MLDIHDVRDALNKAVADADSVAGLRQQIEALAVAKLADETQIAGLQAKLTDLQQQFDADTNAIAVANDLIAKLKTQLQEN